MIALTPRHTYNASLGLVLRALAHMRAGGALLHAAEWRMYSKALHSDCICQRMAVVASVSGDSEEVCCPCLCSGLSLCLPACLSVSLSVCLSVCLVCQLPYLVSIPCLPHLSGPCIFDIRVFAPLFE